MGRRGATAVKAAMVLAWLAVSGAALAQTTFPALGSKDIVQDCGAPAASLDICRVRQAIAVDEAVAHLAGRPAALWRDGTRLRIVTRNPGEVVDVGGSIGAPMARIDGAKDLWSLTVAIPRLDEALIDVFFTLPDDQLETVVWRGPKAAPAPIFRADLTGRIVEDKIDSKALGEARGLTVYLPPGFDPARRYPVAYVADGSSVAFYARIVEPAITDGRLPPLVMVGLHRGRGERRAADYLLGRNGSDVAFEAHERFLLDEVMPRAERLWGASTRREQRLLVGKSSGAGWALDTALRHPDLFGQAAPIALGWTRASGLDRPGRPRLFMVTGVLDSFITRSRAAAEEAAKSGDPLVFQTPVTGHGDAFYQGDWVEILTWAFPAR